MIIVIDVVVISVQCYEPEREEAIDGHDTHVPDRSSAHEHVQGGPDDTDALRQREIACNNHAAQTTIR